MQQPQHTTSLYASVYAAHDAETQRRLADEAATAERESKRRRMECSLEDLTELPALSSFLQISSMAEACEQSDASGNPSSSGDGPIQRDGFQRMQRCRMALDALDQGGWKRSYHQRMFHDSYIAACARPFWKLDPPGSFARAHQRILEINGWESLSQEILISTPRRYTHTHMPSPSHKEAMHVKALVQHEAATIKLGLRIERVGCCVGHVVVSIPLTRMLLLVLALCLAPFLIFHGYEDNDAHARDGQNHNQGYNDCDGLG